MEDSLIHALLVHEYFVSVKGVFVDFWQRVDQQFLWAPFVEQVQYVLEDAAFSGVHFLVTQGFRSFEKQHELFLQVPKVTKADAGESAHNYGLAIDVFCLDGIPWAQDKYKTLNKLCALRGLTWGGSWKTPDLPHVQVSDFTTKAELTPLRNIFCKTAGSDLDKLRAVWHYLERSK